MFDHGSAGRRWQIICRCSRRFEFIGEIIGRIPIVSPGSLSGSFLRCRRVRRSELVIEIRERAALASLGDRNVGCAAVDPLLPRLGRQIGIPRGLDVIGIAKFGIE